MNKLPNSRIYYAQNREDLILESFFGDIKTGFYVDVGACHPDVASVTKRFYLKSWRGINIEPQTNLFKLFERDRKKDINLNIGISNKDTILTLRSYVNNQGLSTIAPELQGKYEEVSGNKTEEYEDLSIKVTTLASVFNTHKVTSIQFLKVDVEGHEYEVLSGNDWEKFRPEVLCVEQRIFKHKDWRALLKDNGYEQVFFDGLNEYYADSKTIAADRFDYIQHVVIELGGGIAASDYNEINALREANKHLTAHTRELENQLKSIKKSLKRTVHLVKRKLIKH